VARVKSASVSTRTFAIAGIAIALLLAFVVAPHASSSPDGLVKVAADQGLDRGAHPSAVAGGPLAGYAVNGVHDTTVSTGVAGIIGVAATGALGIVLFAGVRAMRRRRDASAPARAGAG